MITTLLIYTFGFFLGGIVGLSNFIAGDFSIWPTNVLNGLTYFFTNFMNWDFILNTTELLKMIKFVIGFDIIYVSVRLLLKLFNWVRGAGPLDI